MSFVHRIAELVEDQGSTLTSKADHWERVPLERIARVVNGYPFASSGFNTKTGKPVIRIRDVTSGEASTMFDGDVSEAPKVEHGELVIGMDGDFNSRLWPGDAAWLNQRVCKIEPIGQYYSKSFLAYAIPAYLKLVNDNTSAITVKHLSSATVQELPLPLPPRAEQDRVASKIDELFSRIDEGEAALARVEKLVERYRQSVLKAAVTGELTRDWRASRKRAGEPVESGEALLARILKARRTAWEAAELAKLKAKGKPPADDRWKQKYQGPAPPDTTGLPELPEGWVWASPVQLESDDAHALTIGPFGSDLKVSDYATSGVPLVFVRNIRSASFQGNGTKYVSVAKADALSAHKVRAGDILITKMGDPPGDACVYPTGAPDAIVTADCIKWTLHPLLTSPLFICTFVVSRFGKEQIRDITTGVAQQKVSLSRFRRLAIAVPGLQEQDAINDRVMRVAEQVRRIEAEINDDLMHAKALRQSILKAAFSGQLVPQDPHDEPASKLLERIAAERASASDRPRRKARRQGVNRG